MVQLVAKRSIDFDKILYGDKQGVAAAINDLKQQIAEAECSIDFCETPPVSPSFTQITISPGLADPDSEGSPLSVSRCGSPVKKKRARVAKMPKPVSIILS